MKLKQVDQNRHFSLRLSIRLWRRKKLLEKCKLTSNISDDYFNRGFDQNSLDKSNEYIVEFCIEIQWRKLRWLKCWFRKSIVDLGFWRTKILKKLENNFNLSDLRESYWQNIFNRMQKDNADKIVQYVIYFYCYYCK